VRTAFALLAVAALATSCEAGGAGGAPLPPSPTSVDVMMTEYRFQHQTEVLPGRAVFRVVNAGTEPHSLVLVELEPDMPPIDEQLRGPNRRGVATYAQVPQRPPGNRDVFAVDMVPGRYAFICFVRDAAGQPHALKGMSSEFVVL
jgi:hypothetical protein